MRTKAFRHIFTSPSSVKNDCKATQSGNAWIHGMTHVTKASIAYTATQVSTRTTTISECIWTEGAMAWFNRFALRYHCLWQSAGQTPQQIQSTFIWAWQTFWMILRKLKKSLSYWIGGIGEMHCALLSYMLIVFIARYFWATWNSNPIWVNKVCSLSWRRGGKRRSGMSKKRRNNGQGKGIKVFKGVQAVGSRMDQDNWV